MPDRILYVVARTPEEAERNLLHTGSNPYIMSDQPRADFRAQELSQMWDEPYQTFKARVTVELLED
jgi:hypothetical protein